MKVETAIAILGAFAVIAGLAFLYYPKIKESFSSGGLSTINALGWYNRPQHCWQDPNDGGTHCATDSALML